MEYCDELLGKMRYFIKSYLNKLLIVINPGVVIFVRVIEPVKPESFYLIAFGHA